MYRYYLIDLVLDIFAGILAILFMIAKIFTSYAIFRISREKMDASGLIYHVEILLNMFKYIF